MTNAEGLRNKLQGLGLKFIGVHDGLSATIASLYGFDGLWASGFGITTAFGLRDFDELFPTELINTVRSICNASELDVIVDGNAGYGNFIQARQFSKAVWQAGAKAVCFEDKQFPKSNSFVGKISPLLPVTEFTAKIKASKDYTAGELLIIARTEALIFNQGIEAALERAFSYVEAGADAIFIHSKSYAADEILAFCKKFDKDVPIFIAPTSYVHEISRVIDLNRVNGIILANQLLRAAVSAMRKCAETLTHTLKMDDDQIASMQEIFDLMAYDEIEAAREHYVKSL